jgi:acyl carrier protein
MIDSIGIRDSLLCLVRAELRSPLPDGVLLTATFSELGLDSETLVILSGNLAEMHEVDIDPASLFEFSTIELMAAHVVSLCRNKVGSPD